MSKLVLEIVGLHSLNWPITIQYRVSHQLPLENGPKVKCLEQQNFAIVYSAIALASASATAVIVALGIYTIHRWRNNKQQDSKSSSTKSLPIFHPTWIWQVFYLICKTSKWEDFVQNIFLYVYLCLFMPTKMYRLEYFRLELSRRAYFRRLLFM